MTIREQTHHEMRVRSMATRVEKELDLGWLTIVHKFDGTIGGERIAAETVADWEYRQASITWNVPTVAILTDEALEAILLHELVHVLTAPLWESIPSPARDKLHKLNEFATENVTRALQAARRHRD